MRIRRYTGKDAQEAMLKVKMDLGSEAIILSTRKVRKKGIAGLFSKPLTEVLAAIDEDYGNKKETSEAPKKPKTGLGTYNRQGEMQPPAEAENRVESLESRVKQMESMLEKIYNRVGNNQSERTGVRKEEKEKGISPAAPVMFDSENNLETVLIHQTGPNKGKDSNQRTISGQASEAVKKNEVNRASGINSESATKTAAGANKVTETDKAPENNEAFTQFKRILSDNEIEPAIIEKMIEKIRQFVKNPDSCEEIIAVAEKILQKVLGQAQGIQFREDGKPTVVLFVGPTGVGKTTTLAKIAADYSLNHQKKVGLITADTYRIAAVEQLKTYAEILNIPVSVIYAPQEIKTAVSEHQDKDLILIDTAGRSHKNAAQFSELKMLVSAAEADEVYLVLNCSMGRLACREILNQYGFLKKYKLLFTKLDEALVPGIILNVRYATGKPLSYTTAGQSVPDDIEIADIEEIVKSMLQSKENDG